MVDHDLRKGGLKLTSQDVLIVDFIDERFQVLRLGDTLMTQSKEFNDLDLSRRLGCTPAFQRGTEEEFEAWRLACERFADSMVECGSKVIVHRGLFATQGIDDEGLFDLDKQEYLVKTNIQLRRYYDAFTEAVAPVGSILVPESLQLAEPRHKWGLAPFHYIHEYYEEAWRQLTSIIG